MKEYNGDIIVYEWPGWYLRDDIATGCHNIISEDAAKITLLNMLVNDIKICRDLGDEDRIRICGNAAAEGRMACVAPEHFEHHDAVVGNSCSFEFFDVSGDLVDRGVSTDRIGLEV